MPVIRDFTVANIRDRGETGVDVTFLESARIYRLSRQHPIYHRALEFLREAAKARRVLKVTFSSLDSDVIEDIALG